MVKDIYQQLISYFPAGIEPAQTVHYAQMKIICVVLYVMSAKVNEIRFLTLKDLEAVFKTGNLSLKQKLMNIEMFI